MHGALPVAGSERIRARRRAAGRAALGLLLAGWAGGCSQVPRLRPLPADRRAALQRRCAGVFPQGSFRVVHAIRAALPFGTRTAIVGVTAWDADTQTLRVVGLALEGVTLLDLAWRGGHLTVRRAVPPFDRRDVAEGLLRDVMLLLRPPGAAPVRVGTRPTGESTCRYRPAGGGTVDVVLAGPRARGSAGAFQIFRYGPRGDLLRRVVASAGGPGGFARQMRLERPGAVGYQLSLRLLRVEAGEAAAPAAAAPQPARAR